MEVINVSRTIESYVWIKILFTNISLKWDQFLLAYVYRPLRYERVYLPLYKVADTPFHILGDDIYPSHHSKRPRSVVCGSVRGLAFKNAVRSANVGLMLVQRLRHWPNIKPTLAELFVFCRCGCPETNLSLLGRPVFHCLPLVTESRLVMDCSQSSHSAPAPTPAMIYCWVNVVDCGPTFDQRRLFSVLYVQLLLLRWRVWPCIARDRTSISGYGGRLIIISQYVGCFPGLR